MCRDNVPTITLLEWDLEADYLDDDYLSGVVPVLYAEDPATAEAAILANHETAVKDVEKLNRVFFIPECVSRDEALQIVRKARIGDAEFVFKDRNLDRLFEPLPPTRASEPATTAPGPSQQTGVFSFILNKILISEFTALPRLCLTHCKYSLQSTLSCPENGTSETYRIPRVPTLTERAADNPNGRVQFISPNPSGSKLVLFSPIKNLSIARLIKIL